MKMVSAIATAIITLLSIDIVTAQGSMSSDTSLSGSSGGIYNETVTRIDVPIGTKTYNTGLRTIKNGSSTCAGALITPTHVLTATSCMGQDIRWASIGSHYSNGTQDGELIKVVAMLPYPGTSNPSNDLMVLELERPSSFKPIALAAADGSDIVTGEIGTLVGWRWIQGNGTAWSGWTWELQSADVKFMSNEQCSTMLETPIDDTMFCAGGLANEDPCQSTLGGPLVVKSSGGSNPGQDVLVGVVSWDNDCNTANIPSVLARVSRARAWINSVTSSTCAA